MIPKLYHKSMLIFIVRAVGKSYYKVKYRNKKIEDVRMYCFDF